MRHALPALLLLLQDLLATLLYGGLVAFTHNLPLAIAVGLAVGVGQLAWDLRQGRPVEPLQALSLLLVVLTGGAALLTHDMRFVLAKPTAIYLAVAAAMLKRGWMTRYMPPEAKALLPDLVDRFGYVWAGLMAATAVANLVLVFTVDAKTWAAAMTIGSLASKLVLVLLQLRVMNLEGERRYRADPQAADAALAAAA